MEESGDSTPEHEAPSSCRPSGAPLLRAALLVSAMLVSAGGVAAIRSSVKDSRLARMGPTWNELMSTAEEAGPYDAWHIDHGTADDVKSKSGVNYILKHGKGEEIGNYATWAAAKAATHGGAWLLTFQEEGIEYLCKTHPGPNSKIENGDTYEDYWLPVHTGLAAAHDINDGPDAEKICEQNFRLYHVKHGNEVTSKSGVGYALGHVMSRAGAKAAADKLSAGGAWILTKTVDGKEYLCKNLPGPHSKVENGDTYEGYWKPVFHGLCDAHDIVDGEENADICASD